MEALQPKEEEENSMHNTVVMFSTSDHFTLKQVNHCWTWFGLVMLMMMMMVMGDDNGDDGDGSLSEAALTLLSLQRSCILVEMEILPTLTLFIYDVCVCRTCVWCVAASVREQRADCWPVLSVDSATIPSVSTLRSV